MHQPATAASRVCKTCGVEKLSTDFDKEKRSSSGLYAHCKPCRAIRNKHHKVKYLYGLERDQYDQMLKATPHCPICGSEAPLVVDHDHSTQEVRGLICNNCNVGLGHFKDNQQSLLNAIAYLNNEPLSETTSAEAQMDTSSDDCWYMQGRRGRGDTPCSCLKEFGTTCGRFYP
jgi:transcription elongation factor Elf1